MVEKDPLEVDKPEFLLTGKPIYVDYEYNSGPIEGGGMVDMSATYRVPKVDLEGVTEDDFVCYPRRGDSLSFYKLYDRRESASGGDGSR